MSLSHLPALLASAFLTLSFWLDRRSGARLPQLLLGILLARGRRTVTSWFRAAGITDEYRPAYRTVCAAGRRTDALARSTLRAVQPLLRGPRPTVATDAAPTGRSA